MERWIYSGDNIYSAKKEKEIYSDSINGNPPFNRYHILLCLCLCFINISEGFFISLIFNQKAPSFQKFESANTKIVINFSVYFVFNIIGSILSCFSRSDHWDISSNVIPGILSFVGCISLSLYFDYITYYIVLMLLGLTNGFLVNINTIIMIESFSKINRDYVTILTFSFKIFGFSFYFLVDSFISNFFRKNAYFCIFLAFFEFCATVLLFYIIDSPIYMHRHHNAISTYEVFILLM